MRIYTSIMLSSLLFIGLATQWQAGKIHSGNSQADSSESAQVEMQPDHRGSGRFS